MYFTVAFELLELSTILELRHFQSVFEKRMFGITRINGFASAASAKFCPFHGYFKQNRLILADIGFKEMLVY